ncbi:hypothetical protein [Peptostreptococcus porci]
MYKSNKLWLQIILSSIAYHIDQPKRSIYHKESAIWF